MAVYPSYARRQGAARLMTVSTRATAKVFDQTNLPPHHGCARTGKRRKVVERSIA
jgi:hypothetical protein